MAPDPAILKRKRSRPSDWWAVSPIENRTPPRKDNSTAKKRDRSSNIISPKRTTQEASTTGNRGQSPENKGGPYADPSKDELQAPIEKPPSKKRRGRPSINHVANGLGITPKSPSAPSVGRGEEQVATEHRTVPQRRGLHISLQYEEDGFSEAYVASPLEEETSSNPRRSAVPQLDEPATGEILVKRDVGRGNRRGRPSRLDREQVLASEVSAWEQQQGRSIDTHDELQAGDSLNIENQVSGKRRGRPSIDAQGSSGRLAKRSGIVAFQRRSHRSDAKADEPVPISSAEDLWSRPRGRRSTTVVEVETATSSLAAKRKTRGKVDGPSHVRNRTNAADKTSNSRHLSKVGGKLPEPRGVQHISSSSKYSGSRQRKELGEPADDTQSIKRRKTNINVRLGERESAPIKALPSYQHLAPVTRRVSHQAIVAKWEPLPEGAVTSISQFLHDIQRPVVVRAKDDRRRTQASTALQMVSRRLVGKISKGLPFPPETRTRVEDDFNFEKILDHNRALETQLTPALHANNILQAELNKEISLLESEQAALVELETNSKTETSIRKQAGRKLHPLLVSANYIRGEADLRIAIGLYGKDSAPLSSLDIQEDENLRAIINELDGHVDSIQGNIGQIQGVTEAVAKTKGALQDTLFHDLEVSQYEYVVLA